MIRGHSVVEFALCLPLFILISLAVLDVMLLAVNQFAVDRLGARVADALAVRAFDSREELTLFANRFIQNRSRGPVTVRISLRPLPTQPPSLPYQERKTTEVIDVFLEKSVPLHFSLLEKLGGGSSFVVRSRSRAARIRPYRMEGGDL